MSSVVLWSSPSGHVYASWNKEAPNYTVFVVERYDAKGIAYGRTMPHADKASAIRAAKRLAKSITKIMEAPPEPPDLYATLLALGIETDSHESDLYVKDSPLARLTIAAHGHKPSPFRSAVDGSPWLDVAFAFTPWWEARLGRRA